MAPTVESSGTQTATLATWHDVATPSTAATRVLAVNATNLVAGETLLIRVKKKVLSGGSETIQYLRTYAGPLSEPVVETPPLVIPHTATLSIRQEGGTGRAFEWAVWLL